MEINLLDKYPRIKRPIEERGRWRSVEGEGIRIDSKNRSNQEIYFEQLLLNKVRQFGREYFDGDRLYGYGGYKYDAKFWTETVKRIARFYNLIGNESVLDVGCAKGFLMHDFKVIFPDIKLAGVDISQYAIEQAMEDMRPFIKQGSANLLPFPDHFFDLVISINTVDHLPLEECKKAVQEIQRVAKNFSYIVVNAWNSDEERKKQEKWNLTAQTCLHTDQWKDLFQSAGYTGDYYWFFAT